MIAEEISIAMITTTTKAKNTISEILIIFFLFSSCIQLIIAYFGNFYKNFVKTKKVAIIEKTKVAIAKSLN